MELRIQDLHLRVHYRGNIRCQQKTLHLSFFFFLSYIFGYLLHLCKSSSIGFIIFSASATLDKNINACKKLLFIQQILIEYLLCVRHCYRPTMINTYKVPVAINTYLMSDHINIIRQIKHF